MSERVALMMEELRPYQLPQADPKLVLRTELEYLDGMTVEARCLYFTYLGLCESEELEPLSPMRWHIDMLAKSSPSDMRSSNSMDESMAARLSDLNAELRMFFSHNHGIL
jgi:hypothetical protein